MGVVDVVMANLLQRYGAEIGEGRVAIPVVEGIEGDAGIGVVGLLHNAPGIGEIVDALEKTDVLEGGANAFLPTYLQKIRITFGQMILSGEFQRRGGNDVRRAQPGGKGESAMRFVFDELIFPAVHVAPLTDGDHAGDDEAVVGQRLFHLAHFTAASDEIIDVINPQLDAVVAGLSGQLDFLQQRLGLDGAGVEAEFHRHGC